MKEEAAHPPSSVYLPLLGRCLPLRISENSDKQKSEMIAPHRRNRKKPRTQDGRKLRRYKRRWKIERLFAWLGNFRRLVVRYERRVENYLGLLRLGCIVILLRYL